MIVKTKILVIIFQIFCLQIIFAQQKRNYKVIEIDSTSSYYFITVKTEFKRYLIVSPKSDFKNVICNKISISNKYRFALIKYIPNKQIPERKNFSISLDDKIVWKNGGKFSAYTTNSLLGLCYLKNN